MKEKLGDDSKGELCLIFAGKILKDEDSLESHGNPVGVAFNNFVYFPQE